MCNRRVFLAGLVAVLVCVQMTNALAVPKRSASESETILNQNASTKKGEVCSLRTPCGWAIFNKITQYIEYFMENTCICPVGMKCMREEEDITITAYVYRCQVETNSTMHH